MTGGLTISSQFNDVTISSDVTAANISIQAEDVGLNGNVTTTGNQTYQSVSGSGGIEFNGTYSAGGGIIELLGEGTFGVSLGLNGDTTIDAGTGEFSVPVSYTHLTLPTILLV